MNAHCTEDITVLNIETGTFRTIPDRLWESVTGAADRMHELVTELLKVSDELDALAYELYDAALPDLDDESFGTRPKNRHAPRPPRQPMPRPMPVPTKLKDGE